MAQTIENKDTLRFITANSNFACNLRIQKIPFKIDSDNNVAHYFRN